MTKEILWNNLRNKQLKPTSVVLPREKETKKFKGYAFVGFETFEDSIKAKKIP